MGLANTVDAIFSAINKAARGYLASYSILETAYGQVICCTDGSVATLVRYHGTVSIGGKADLRRLSKDGSVALNSFFSRPGHALQVYYYRDPDRSKDLITQATLPSRNIATNIGMDLEDLFNEEVAHLSKYIADEEVYFVLWTRPAVLPKAELKALEDQRKAPDWWPKARDTQSLHTVSEEILAHHRAYVRTFVSQLRSMKVSLDVVNVDEAIRAIRNSIDVGEGHPGFKPYMPTVSGKRADGAINLPPPRLPAAAVDEDDYGYLLWPSLNSQIFDKGATIRGNRVELGDKLYAPIDLTMGQMTQTWFNDLIDRMRDIEDVPWRVSFLLEGDGLSGARMMKMIAGLTSFLAKANNKLITETFDTLSRYSELDGSVARMRVSFATWGSSSKPEIVEARANKLQRAVEFLGLL